MPPSARPAAALVVVVACVTACAGQDSPEPTVPDQTAAGGAEESTPASGPAGRAGTPAGAALFLAPNSVTHVTITDFDAIRARLGVPEMTSESLMTDRIEFWNQVPDSTVLLTDGVLREDNSLFALEYGFTQDDVDWEARWVGDTPGLALGMRHDLDLAGVNRALGDEVEALAGAEVAEAESVVVRGAAGADAVPLAADPVVVRLADTEAESVYLRRGCIPFHDALGVDATVEHQDEVVAGHDVEGLLPVEGIAVAFTGRNATFRVAYPADVTAEQATADLVARADLAADWPLVESITFADGFGAGDAEEPRYEDGVGELDLQVSMPGAAATLALTDLLPVGVCNEVPPMAEPTGLSPGG